MKLTEYLKSNTQKSLADRVGVSVGLVSQWKKGLTKITAERAKQIEYATGGKVTRHELRPDIFDGAA